LSASKLDHLRNQRNLLRFQKIHLEILALDKALNFIIRKKQGRRGKVFLSQILDFVKKKLDEIMLA
jgi:hypothetical protein